MKLISVFLVVVLVALTVEAAPQSSISLGGRETGRGSITGIGGEGGLKMLVLVKLSQIYSLYNV